MLNHEKIKLELEVPSSEIWTWEQQLSKRIYRCRYKSSEIVVHEARSEESCKSGPLLPTGPEFDACIIFSCEW